MVDERDAQPAAVCHVSTVESARNLGSWISDGKEMATWVCLVSVGNYHGLGFLRFAHMKSDVSLGASLDDGHDSWLVMFPCVCYASAARPKTDKSCSPGMP